MLALLVLCPQFALDKEGLLWNLFLPYVVLWLGLRKPPRWLAHFGRNDYSYGWYVWGMVCQHCVVRFAGVTSLWPHVILAAIATGFCAYGSWHLLEKPALALKHRKAATGSPSPAAPMIAQPQAAR
ncbi:MAG: hypothetical protein P4L83_14675 [Nevskia sp.]|nr:hypothetical protein [Nevskia sp.]